MHRIDATLGGVEMTSQRALWACGGALATTAATVILVAAIGHFTGFNLFSFSLWFIVPVGALLCGAAALSGFYIVAHRLHLRPGFWMLAPLVLLATGAYFSIYFLEYAWLTLDDGTRASEIVTFPEYLTFILANQTIYTGRGGHVSAPLGEAGYWFAALEFIGFIIGGAWIYIALAGSRACAACQQYLRKRGSRIRYFATPEDADDYYSDLFAHPLDSDEFARQASLGSDKASSEARMTVLTELHDCEGCHRQLWIDIPSVFDGKEWREIKSMVRETVLPPQSNVARFVRGGAAPSWFG